MRHTKARKGSSTILNGEYRSRGGHPSRNDVRQLIYWMEIDRNLDANKDRIEHLKNILSILNKQDYSQQNIKSDFHKN